jgi:FAD synthetase
MKRVLAMGTFDVVHEGHVAYLEQARKHGDYLIVVVARDVTVEKERGKKALNNEGERVRSVQMIDAVDEVVLGGVGDKLAIVLELKPDVICLGYDQKVDSEKLETELGERGLKVNVCRMKSYHPEKFKSSLLKGKL